MNFTTLFAGGAVLGFVSACWSHIKNFAWKMLNYLVVHVYIDSTSRVTLMSHLLKKYNKSPIHDHSYFYKVEWQKLDDITFRGMVPYERFLSDLVFWDGWYPIFMTKEDGNSKSSCVSFIRGTIDFDKVLAAAFQERNNIILEKRKNEKRKNTRYHIHHVPEAPANPGKNKVVSEDDDTDSLGLPWYQCGSRRLIYHDRDTLGINSTNTNSRLENLIFPDHIVKLQEEIKLWVNSEKAYNKFGLPWKRGWLLYGPPGTGKTALTRAFAEAYDLPVFSFNLSRLTNDTLMSAWSAMQSSTPCIALFEDFDNVFHLRKNISAGTFQQPTGKRGLPGSEKGKPDDDPEQNPMGPQFGYRELLTFDCFLNCLDGVEVSNGVFTIITTNDLSKIDPALGIPRETPDIHDVISTRPGRIDKVIELTYMHNPEKRIMAKRMLAAYPETLDEVLKFIDDFPDLKETPAQFQERCGQIALKCYLNDENNLTNTQTVLEEIAKKNAYYKGAMRASCEYIDPG